MVLHHHAVHWDGNSWELNKISVLFRGNLIMPPLEGIFAFSSSDIWFVGSLPIHGDGNNWKIYDLRTTVDPNLSLSKSWGINSDNIYFVGRNGSIAHYDGSKWTKIDSGTSTIINDIWGTNNLILCAVSNIASAGDRKILKIESKQVSEFLWDTGRRIHSIWFKSSNAIYTCGGGVFFLKDGKNWNEVTEIPLYYTRAIRGNGLNDIIVVGDFGLLAHFNGTSWKLYESPTADIYYSCAVKENLVVAVGMKGNSGFIAVANK